MHLTKSRKGAGLIATLAVFAGIAAIGAAAAGAQSTAPNPDKSIHDPVLTALPDANAQMEMRDKKAREQSFDAANTERKKQIADDSARLLQLATELKAEVDKTTKDTLSLAVIRKADEIEKLAHDVKTKMKLTVGSN
jgi:hypothetical protein